MLFRLPKFAAGLAAGAVLSLAATAAQADDFIDYSTPGLVFVNGTPGCDVILMGTLCDGSIGAIRISGWCIDAGVINTSLIAGSAIIVNGGDGDDLIDTACVAAGATLETHGGNGDDTILCGPSDDLVFPEGGNDYVFGGDGNDTILDISGTGFKDRLFGGDGDDSITDHDGVTAAQGGKGMDSIFVSFAAAWDDDHNAFNTRKSIGAITGGAGDDGISIVVNGSAIKFTIDGDGGPGTPGMGDVLDITGPVGAGSTYPNVDFRFFFP